MTNDAATYCNHYFDGLGTECRRCGSWKRGAEPPECPPYITRCEPDGDRLPHIKTREDNRQAWITWAAIEDVQHPLPHAGRDDGEDVDAATGTADDNLPGSADDWREAARMHSGEEGDKNG